MYGPSAFAHYKLLFPDTLGKNDSNQSIVFPHPEPKGILGNEHSSAGTKEPLNRRYILDQRHITVAHKFLAPADF